MRLTMSLLACAALLAACQSGDGPTTPSNVASTTAAPTASASVTHVKQRTEVVADDIIENPCTGEDIQFHFDQLFILYDLELEGRAFHSHGTAVDRGSTGVGLTTGIHYRQVGVQHTSFFISGQIEEVQTFTLNGGVIGQGSTPDFDAHDIFHVTVTPAGDVKVEFEKASFVCR